MATRVCLCMIKLADKTDVVPSIGSRGHDIQYYHVPLLNI